MQLLTGLKTRFGIPSTPIEEGKTVCISMFETESEWMLSEEAIRSTSKNAALLNKKLKGKPLGVYNNKKLIYND